MAEMPGKWCIKEVGATESFLGQYALAISFLSIDISIWTKCDSSVNQRFS